MAQVNLQIRDQGAYRESKSFEDDLTLRSYTGKLMIINVDSLVSSGGKVFLIRNPSMVEVSSISLEGDASFKTLKISGDSNLGNLSIEGTSLFKDHASGYFDINKGFFIEGVSTAPTVNALNLNRLTNGDMITNLHYHKVDKYIDVIVSNEDGDFNNLWDALESLSEPSVICVVDNQTTDISRIISTPHEIIFKPGVHISCSSDINSSVIKFGEGVVTKNFTLKLSHTGTTHIGFEMDSNSNYHDNLKIIIEDANETGLLTNAFIVNDMCQVNYIRGSVTSNYPGAVANIFVDNSNNVTNDVSIRSAVI